MTAFSLCFLAILSLYFYFHFIAKHSQPALAGANLPNQVLFDNIVPTAGGNEELELAYEPDDQKFKPELVEDAETALLFEAEKLLTEIETIVSSNQDVYSRLSKVVPNYGLFRQTDYYEMINKYIMHILKEECGIALDKEELEALWV